MSDSRGRRGAPYAPSERIPDPGYIYALTNESMPGLLKIGKTKTDPGRRARELDGTGVPTPFEVAWTSAPLANVTQAEITVHRALAKHRLRRRREFFEIDLSKAAPHLTQVENRFLDSEWLARQEKLEKAARDAEAERVRKWREKQQTYAAVRAEFDAWADRAEVILAFERASRLPKPAHGVGEGFGCLLLVASVAGAAGVEVWVNSIFRPIHAGGVFLLVLVGLLIAGSQAVRPVIHKINNRRHARFRQVWNEVKDVTPVWLSHELEWRGWMSEDLLRAELDKRAPTPEQEKARDAKLLAELQGLRMKRRRMHGRSENP